MTNYHKYKALTEHESSSCPSSENISCYKMSCKGTSLIGVVGLLSVDSDWVEAPSRVKRHSLHKQGAGGERAGNSCQGRCKYCCIYLGAKPFYN